jgi:sugar phosphate permease
MIGQSLGFVGGWIAEEYSWSRSFTILGFIGIAFSAILLFVLKDAPQSNDQRPVHTADSSVSFLKGVKGLFSSNRFIVLLVYWSLLGIVTWLVVGWLPTYYKEHFNLSQAISGVYATGYIYPASLCGVLLGGFLADRWSKHNNRARILVPAIGLCIAAPGIFMASSTSILPLATALFMLYALTRAFCDTNMMPILCLVADARYRATGYGILNMFSCIVGGIGLYAGGYLRDMDVNLSSIYQFAAFTVLVCAALLFTVKPRTTDGVITGTIQGTDGVIIAGVQETDSLIEGEYRNKL